MAGEEAERSSKADIQLAIVLGQIQESTRRTELTTGGLAAEQHQQRSLLTTISNQVLELTKWKNEQQAGAPRARTPSVTNEVISKTSESIQAIAQETAVQTPMLRRTQKSAKWAPYGAAFGAFAAAFAANAFHSCQPVGAQAQQQPPALTAPAGK